jgi:hypothetical protein
MERIDWQSGREKSRKHLESNTLKMIWDGSKFIKGKEW